MSRVVGSCGCRLKMAGWSPRLRNIAFLAIGLDVSLAKLFKDL
jgi:hypothetical protein